jgi:hypothetical protein
LPASQLAAIPVGPGKLASFCTFVSDAGAPAALAAGASSARSGANWVCLAQYALRRLGRCLPRLAPISGRIGKLASFCRRLLCAIFTITPFPPSTCPFLSLRRNWLRFASLPPDGWQRQGLRPWRWSSRHVPGKLGSFYTIAPATGDTGLSPVAPAARPDRAAEVARGTNWLRFARTPATKKARTWSRKSVD